MFMRIFSTIYAYSIDFLRIVIMPLPVLVVFFLALVIVYYGKKRIKQDYTYRYLILFFAYIFGIFSFIFLVIMLIKIPNAINQEKRIRDIIQTESYNMVEGNISNYSLEEYSGQHIHRFDINDIHFEYINYDKFLHFGKKDQISDFPIDPKAIYRISYYSFNGDNIILRIEVSN